jgi:hypothetical protein
MRALWRSREGVLMALVSSPMGRSSPGGHCYSGKCDVPSPNEGFIAVAGGGHHSLGLRYLEPTVVSFDIHPRSCPNPFNIKGSGRDHTLPKKGGVLPAAIVGSEGFNVSEIDTSTLFLEGIAPLRTDLEDVTRPVIGNGECACTTEGPDGILDLTLKFSRQEIASILGEVEHGDVVELTITGELIDGTPFEASDCITILSKHPEPRIEADSDEVKLYPAIPNPFNPSTTISYYLPVACNVTLEIYDSSGRLISRLMDRVNKPKGLHEVEWKGIDEHGRTVASGVYFYRLITGKETISKKMVLLK